MYLCCDVIWFFFGLMMVHSRQLTKSNKDGAFEDEFSYWKMVGFSSAMLVLPEDIDKYFLWATYMLLVPSIQTGVWLSTVTTFSNHVLTRMILQVALVGSFSEIWNRPVGCLYEKFRVVKQKLRSPLPGTPEEPVFFVIFSWKMVKQAAMKFRVIQLTSTIFF